MSAAQYLDHLSLSQIYSKNGGSSRSVKYYWDKVWHLLSFKANDGHKASVLTLLRAEAKKTKRQQQKNPRKWKFSINNCKIVENLFPLCFLFLNPSISDPAVKAETSASKSENVYKRVFFALIEKQFIIYCQGAWCFYNRCYSGVNDNENQVSWSPLVETRP